MRLDCRMPAKNRGDAVAARVGGRLLHEVRQSRFGGDVDEPLLGLHLLQAAAERVSPSRRAILSESSPAADSPPSSVSVAKAIRRFYPLAPKGDDLLAFIEGRFFNGIPVSKNFPPTARFPLARG